MSPEPGARHLLTTVRFICRFARAYNASYRPLLLHTRGNGEDLAINHLARSLGRGAAQVQIRGAVTALDDGGGYYADPHHWFSRGRICRCLSANDAEKSPRDSNGEALLDCVVRAEGTPEPSVKFGTASEAEVVAAAHRRRGGAVAAVALLNAGEHGAHRRADSDTDDPPMPPHGA